jgi:4-diphosphocytidyl-2-C-methyl-D-erythritol kinase
MISDKKQSLTIPAYAKINLSLDVLRKRKDGYHDLHMVMQQVALCDRIHIRLSSEPGIHLKTDASFLPSNRGNIAWRAAELLGTRSGINLDETGVVIKIEKRIPVAAGLAGGSADAAAVLKGLNQLWRLGLSIEELQILGLQLGADVPYCLMGGTALAEGIGDRLTPLVLAKNFWVLLIKPAISVSTREVYRRLNLDQIHQRPDNLALMSAMKNADAKGMAEAMANVLETVTIPLVPEIDEIKHKMLEFNAIASLMSGSGPTVFGLFKDREKAQAAGNKLSLIYREVQVTHTLPVS